MTEIKITVDVPGLSEAINNLAEALRKPSAATVSADSTTPTSLPEKPVEPVKDAEATANTTAEGKTPTKKENPKKPQYSLAELSAAGAELMDAGKMQDLMNLIASFGVQAITQLPADKYPELADGLKALGAKFKD